MLAAVPIEDFAVGARFLWSVPGFLRHPLSLEEARAILRGRLDHREDDFLALAKRAIYDHAASPYRQLLRLAGCEYGDLERLTRQDGVEGALHALYCRGVYLTVEEFKGRRPAVRGSSTITIDPGRLRNPLSRVHVFGRSSGSRGTRTPVPIDLRFIRDRAVNTGLALNAHGGAEWVHANWEVPGGSAIGRLLWLSSFGSRPVRWFSQVDPSSPSLPARYRWSARLLRWGSLLAGTPLPRPRYVPLAAPLPIARWMAGLLRRGRTPMLHTFPSSAVRLCAAAFDAGIDLGGAQFAVVGEPITPARLAVIGRVGAVAMPVYGSAEVGRVGYGCMAPTASDDVHVLHDLVALVQPGPAGKAAQLPDDALLISSLRPTAPLILLNVSLGDRADVGERSCGCAMERLGWTTHLQAIRSFEKLTAGGMTFLDTDVVRVLEVGLPARFGGGPTDYQLVEEETADGHPHVRLIVDPRIGPLNPEAVAHAFLTAIGRGPGAERVMELQWRQAGLVQVERRSPLTEPSGKILHLHKQGRPSGKIPYLHQQGSHQS